MERLWGAFSLQEFPNSPAQKEARLSLLFGHVREDYFLNKTQRLLHGRGMKSYLCHFKHLFVSSPAIGSYSFL